MKMIVTEELSMARHLDVVSLALDNHQQELARHMHSLSAPGGGGLAALTASCRNWAQPREVAAARTRGRRVERFEQHAHNLRY
jgi:hypothetical protein